MTAAVELLPSGAMLGPYRVVRRIGAGGMGEVYEAVHTGLSKKVALKTLHSHLALNPDSARRFTREGEAAARIRHPNVVDITDVGVANGVPYLVMEFLEGESLANRLRRDNTAVSPEQTVEWLLPVAAAVAEAHRQGVVHRDLKPDNIFLEDFSGGTRVPKVLDFGISKVVTGDKAELTSSHAVLGTPSYMSPEQARESKRVDPRTDQYALGVILYECVTGRRPHDAESLPQLLVQIIEARFPPPREVLPSISPALEAIILRAMALNPADRFPSVLALGEALLEFASPRTRALWETTFQRDASESGAFADTVAAPPVQTPAHPGVTPAHEKSGVSRVSTPRRRPVLVLAAVLLAGVSAALILNRQAPQPPSLSRSEPSAAPTQGSYRIAVSAVPSHASFDLDGVLVGSGRLDLSVPKDGALHTLRISATEHTPQIIRFRDAPPPEAIVLERVATAASATSPASAAAPKPAAVPAGGRPSKQHGAPILP